MFHAFGDLEESQPSTSSSIQSSQPCRHFEFPEILSATNNFDESLVIGHGGFGKVYKGNIISGSDVIVAAIKRLDSMSAQGAPEFWAEVKMLSKVRHCHLVSLLGYCIYENEMILIYEYVPDGTLADHLHELGTTLSWLQRLKICIGAARGLDYLHTGMGINFGVIHRDVKTSNILLHAADENWAAKISDFGLSKIGPTNQKSTHVNTLVKGTFGYLDPDYYQTGRLTRKSDVYAFGVVLFEVLCRKRAVDQSLDEVQWNLARWAQESIKEGNLKHIIDSDIRGQISPKCLKDFVRIAERCLHTNPRQRPTMAEVVVSLDFMLTLQDKMSSAPRPASRTIFGRMVDIFPFPSNEEYSGHGDPKLSGNNKDLKVFKFADLRIATRNFSQDLLLGKVDFEHVFLAWVDNNTFAPSTEDVGIAVAVKWYKEGLPDWQDAFYIKGGRTPGFTHGKLVQEVVRALGLLDHPNILSLLGYCIDEANKCLLVYEYIRNGNFAHFLFGDVAETLSWRTRLRIMRGVARGLDYMHSSKSQIIRLDVRTSNILLDQDFNAKLGDFGTPSFGPEIGGKFINTRLMGAIGHVDPWKMGRIDHMNVKSDIYSFGVVMLETLTGQRAWEQHIHRFSLVMESLLLTNQSKLKKIMDPRLEHNYPLEGASRCVVLALRCVAEYHKDRPSIEEILQCLEEIYSVN